MNLYDKLTEYGESDYYGFHMPGHKRNKEICGGRLPYDIDITEIEGFDDLHHAKGILKEAQERAAEVYHAEETHFLINGSTSGILSAILGSTVKGDRILAARNCHKSVYHAILMNELEATYVYPQYLDETELNGPVLASDVEKRLSEDSGIRAVVITSPTYDGVVSDVDAISKAVHRYGIPLIVDEAHGAHFGLHPFFPQNSNTRGADVVIHSLHKTLPSLTQTALIHMNGNIADRKRIKRYLHMLQTSSPSYVLMAGMDACLEEVSRQGEAYFDKYAELLKETRKKLGNLKHLRLVETKQFDKSKIIISVNNTGFTSTNLYNILLNEFHLQMEMRAGSYVLAMTSVGDTEEGMDRLVSALEKIDLQVSAGFKKSKSNVLSKEGRGENLFRLPELEKRYSSAKIDNILQKGMFQDSVSENLMEASIEKPNPERTKYLPWNQCIGCISVEYAYVYPPGIPLIVPGEVISREAARLLEEYRILEFSIEGPEKAGEIEVLVNG